MEVKGEDSRDEERMGEVGVTVGDCRTEENTWTSLRRGVSVGMPSADQHIVYINTSSSSA